MKGLLLKDFYTLRKTMKVFLLMLLIFSFTPNMQMTSFAIVYSAMLPITALAYDERSKWDELAAMMPYTAHELVFSKYLLGYLAILGASVLSVAAQFSLSAFGSGVFGMEELISLLLMVCIASIMMSVNLPFLFKLGVERGRLVFFGIISVMIFVGMMMKDYIAQLMDSQIFSSPLPLILGVLCLSLALNIASSMISEKLYLSKRK